MNEENKVNKVFSQKDIDDAMHLGWKAAEHQYSLNIEKLKERIKELEKQLKKERPKDI